MIIENSFERAFMDYNLFTDEELCNLAREGDGEAESFLLNKYKSLVKSRAKKLFIIGGELDDLIQEGMIGLFLAVRSYDEEKGAAFSTFARLALERRMYNAIKLQNTKKNRPLNNYVSLNRGEGMEREAESIHLLRAGEANDPEALLIDRENRDFLMDKLDKELSGFEKEVLKLTMLGKDYKDIGEELDRSPKSIDNALQRIRRKLREIVLLSNRQG